MKYRSGQSVLIRSVFGEVLPGMIQQIVSAKSETPTYRVHMKDHDGVWGNKIVQEHEILCARPTFSWGPAQMDEWLREEIEWPTYIPF